MLSQLLNSTQTPQTTLEIYLNLWKSLYSFHLYQPKGEQKKGLGEVGRAQKDGPVPNSKRKPYLGR